MLLHEIDQCEDEGVVIPKEIEGIVQSLDPSKDGWDIPLINELLRSLDELPRNSDQTNAEPNELDEIRRLSKSPATDRADVALDAIYEDRIDAAWRGRLFGCALGLPYERLGCASHGGRNIGTQRVQDHLRSTSNFPIVDFAKELPDSDVVWGGKSLSDSITGMEPDDDIHFTIANLCVVEKFGAKFTWSDIADWWIGHLPLTEFCTAEAQALLNYASRTARWGSDGGARSSATPSFTRRNLNPYREWIGAQIRSDLWGWLSPSQPMQATEFAHRDASWTHERNGIYSAMFFSAMQSLAFTIDGIENLIESSLNFIPPNSRLAKAIRATVDISDSVTDWNTALSRILQELNDRRRLDLSPVHSINNSSICVLALLHGRDEPLHATKLAVMSGYDTDCNGATVGAISGVLFGKEMSNSSLLRKMNGSVSTRISGNQHLLVSDLVERTISVARKIADRAP